MEIRKEIIRPGKTVYIDQVTGKEEVLDVTPDYVKYLHDQGNMMRAAKLTIPVPLEHQPSARAMTPEDLAANQILNNAGETTSYEIGELKEKGSDGKEVTIKDVLFGKLNIKDEKVWAKIKDQTIKHTSPWINSFTDGAGRRWKNVISHVALTTRPRIVDQQPFAVDMAAALSLVNAKPAKTLTPTLEIGEFSLSKAGRLVQKDGAFKPRFPVAFSLMSGIRLSKEEVKEIEKDEEDEEKDLENNRSPMSKIGKDDSADAIEKDVSVYEMIEHLLKVHGFSPPQGIDKSSFVRDIYETLMAKLHEINAKADEQKKLEQKPQPGQQPNQKPVVQETPTMYASLDEVNKIADPKEREMAGRFFALQEASKKQVADLEAQAAKDRKRAESVALSIMNAYRATRDQRVTRLAERLPAATRDKLIKMMAAPSAALSLNDDGQVVDPMADSLDIMESSIKNLPALLSTPAQQVVEQRQPTNGSIISEERRQEIVKEVLNNTGHRQVA